MSLPKDMSTEPEFHMEGGEMPTLCQGNDTSDLCELPNVKENMGGSDFDIEGAPLKANASSGDLAEQLTEGHSVDTSDLCEVPYDKESVVTTVFKANAPSGNMVEQLTESDSTVKQPILTSSAPVESQRPGEEKHVPKDASVVSLEKETPGVLLSIPSSITSLGQGETAEPSDVTTNLTETEPSALQTATHCGGGSKAEVTAGDSIVEAHAKDVIGGPSLSSTPSTHDTDVDASLALSVDIPDNSVSVEGAPLLRVESPPPLMAEVHEVETKKNIATTPRRPVSAGVSRPAQAPPVLQPEIITIDDDEPVCNFEEPPLLLPEVAMTRKRKGIVRKRSFFGDTVDSGILKESILEGSPAKRANKSGMSSIAPPKPSAQTAFTSRLKDDGVTVLISRCGKSGGVAVVPKPKTPTKSGMDAANGDRKRPEDQSARARLLNRQPLEKKSTRVPSLEAKDGHKTEQKTFVIVPRDKPLGRRMGSGGQPCRRSGAARYRTPSVRGQGCFGDATADHRITSTGWRSVPPLSLGDVSTHCGYAKISGHAREVFAPVPPPPGNLVALPRDPELVERMQKVADGDEPDPDGVFTSTALEGFLEEEAPLKLSFPVPDCLMPREREKPSNEDPDPEYQPPAQPARPAFVRLEGERRFKTLLEKQVWLGIRDAKDLKAARPIPSPSKDAVSSEALPLYSLLLPPRYLTPARSSRDLSVHRSRRLLPLCKVMHKSLDIRRAWDQPDKSADCVQFVCDRHHQVRIRGSGSLNDGPTARAYGKLLRPEAVELKLNAWRQNDYRASTEVVSRQQALLVAATVQAPPPPSPASDKLSPRQQSPRTPRPSASTPRSSPLAVRHSSRTPRPRRRLLLDHCETGKRTDPPGFAKRTCSVTAEKEDSTSLEQEEHAASKQENSTADQEVGSTADKQHLECSVTDQSVNEIVQGDNVGGTEDSLTHEPKDVDDEERVGTLHQNKNDGTSERETVLNEKGQLDVDTQQKCASDLMKDAVNQVEDKDVKEHAANCSVTDQPIDEIKHGDDVNVTEDSVAHGPKDVADEEDVDAIHQNKNDGTSEKVTVANEKDQLNVDTQQECVSGILEEAMNQVEGKDVEEHAAECSVTDQPIDEIKHGDDVDVTEDIVAHGPKDVADEEDVDAIHQSQNDGTSGKVTVVNKKDKLNVDIQQECVSGILEEAMNQVEGKDVEEHAAECSVTDQPIDEIKLGDDVDVTEDSVIHGPKDVADEEEVDAIHQSQNDGTSGRQTVANEKVQLDADKQQEYASDLKDRAVNQIAVKDVEEHVTECPVTDQPIDETEQGNDVDVAEGIVAHGPKDVADKEKVDAAHQNKNSETSEKEHVANENDQLDVYTQQEQSPNLEETTVNQVEDENVEEEMGDTADKTDVSDHQEQEHPSPGYNSTPDRQEYDVTDHQKDIICDRKNTCFDSRQENKMSECGENVLYQQNDNAACCHKDDSVDAHGGHVDNATHQQKGCSLDQEENELTDQEVDSFAGALTSATPDDTDTLKHSLNEIARSNESKRDDIMSTDTSCQSTLPVCEPGLQRSNSREAEVQASLGPDTLEDSSAVACVDPNDEDVSDDSETEKMFRAKTSQKIDTSDFSSSVDQIPEGAVADMSRQQSVDAKPVAHLAFFKTLLEGSNRPRGVCTVTTKQPQVSDGVSSVDGGKHLEDVKPGETIENTANVVSTAEEEASVASSLNSTQTMETAEDIKSEDQSQNPALVLPTKIESSSGEAETREKSLEIKEECFSGEEVESCEKSPSDVISPQTETKASDCAAQNNAENFDSKDDGLKATPSASNQTPSAAAPGTAVKSEPLSGSECGSDVAAAVRRPCVHLPRFRLTAVRPYCILHEVYDCAEYRPGGSCYLAPQGQRMLQLQRNLAIRTGRLPPLPVRHLNSARTFGRVRRKLVRPRPVADSCVALLPVPDGTPMPPARAPPATRRLPLPENVRISQVREVVLLTPARPADGSPCHGVQLHSGALVRVGPGAIRPNVPWRMQPADNVVVTAADGRCFRNARDRGCTDAVDVEGSGPVLIQFPLAEVNRSLAEGRMALTSGPDGGLTLMAARMRVMCRDRLRRVAVSQRGRSELFGSGSVVAMDTAGQLAVIGAVAPDTPPGDAAEADSNKASASQPAERGPSGGTGPSAAAADDDSDVPEVVGTVQGGVTQRQQTTGHKRTADGDVNPTGRKRKRARGGQRVGLAPRSSGGDVQGKAARALFQPRSSNGKFLSPAKRAAKTPDDANTRTKDVDTISAKAPKNKGGASLKAPVKTAKDIGGTPVKTSAKTGKVFLVPTKGSENTRTTSVSASETESAPPLSPSWVMNRLHSVTVQVLPAAGKPAVAKKSPEPTVNHVSTGSKGKRLTATDVLMSAVQKLARGSTNPVKSAVSADKIRVSKPSTASWCAGAAGVPSSLEAVRHGTVGHHLPTATQLIQMSHTNAEAGRKLKLAVKQGAPAEPTSAESAPNSCVDFSRLQSLLRQSAVAAAAASVASTARSPRNRAGQRPAQGTRRKRPAGSLAAASGEMTPPACDPTRPKVRRKSWADLSTSRRSWTVETDAPAGASEGAAEAVVPRRRSWDNPAARKSWMDPQSGRQRVRRRSDNPQAGGRRRAPAASRRRSGERQSPPRPDCDGPPEEAAARLGVVSSRPPPTLLRCDGVPVRRRSGGGRSPLSAAPATAAPAPAPASASADPISAPAAPAPAPEPGLVDLTTPEKVRPTKPPAGAELTPSARRRLKLPLEVTLLDESDMSDDGLDDLKEIDLPADVASKDVYCPNIELIEL